MRAHLKPTTTPPVPMADGKPWPAGGEEVELDAYVRRRLADGDLIESAVLPAAHAPAGPALDDAGAVDPAAPAADETTIDAAARRRKSREG